MVFSTSIATKGHKLFLLSFQRHENTYEMFKNHIKDHNVYKCCKGRSVKIRFSCETLIIKSSVFTTEREYTQRLKHSYNNHLSCSMLISPHKNAFDKD